MPNDSTALQRVCKNLLPIIAVNFKMKYEAIPVYQLYSLQEAVGSHLDKYNVAQAENKQLDMSIALELAGKIGELLTQYEKFSPQQQGVVVAAARYFVDEEDAMPDTDSRLGLDDDIAVFNAVAQELGLANMVIYP